MTYAALDERTGKLAGHLADNGIAASDTVAIFLPNSVPWVESCFAIARAGAISVPISYDSTETEIAYRLADANCKAVFTTAERGDLFARLQALRAQSRNADRDRSRRLRRAGVALCEPGDGAAEIGAARSRFAARHRVHSLHVRHDRPRQGRALTVHGMLWVNAACWAPITGLSERDTVLSPLPLFHSYALNLSVLSILATGATVSHHGEVLDQRSGAAPQDRRIHLFSRRADHVSLFAAGDARRRRI